MGMKILMVGPYPPPHGGVSVHVALASRGLNRAGACCRVLNTDRRARSSEEYIRARGPGLAWALLRHARSGWIVHCQTNGHNVKSWLMALLCGLAGRLGPGSVLTLHSGMAPVYLGSAAAQERWLARLACSLYDRIICVSGEVKNAIEWLGVTPDRLEVLPAFLPGAREKISLPEPLDRWIGRRKPLLSTALFFRPEYGFELLMEALSRLRRSYPDLGCLVLGSGEQQEEAQRLVVWLSLEDAVLLAGDVSHDLCLELISRSNLFVRPAWKDGDAISVREALRLGVSVVASDAAPRPTGTIRFRTGSVADLAAKMEAALLRPAANREAAEGAGAEGIQRLLEIYRQLPARGGGYQEERAPAALKGSRGLG